MTKYTWHTLRGTPSILISLPAIREMKVALQIILIINCLISYGQDDCIKYDSDKYVPINLDDALSYLDCKWSDSDKKSFKNKSEHDAVGEIHHGTGRAIRNSWGLWKGNSEIANYFYELDINHPDDCLLYTSDAADE